MQKIIYLVEDSDDKAKLFRVAAQRLRPDIEVIRVSTLSSWIDVLATGIHPETVAIVTDWSFPRAFDRAVEDLGNRVLDSVEGLSYTRAVISGGTMPANFHERYPTVPWFTSDRYESIRAWLERLVK